MVYIFPHVPKCAGTSLEKQLRASDLTIKFDYDGWTGPEAIKLNQQANSENYTNFDIIFGHFPIERYVRWNYKYIALVRDPVERARSNYDFHRFLGVNYPHDYQLYARIGRMIDRGDLSFIEYISLGYHIRTTYKDFLGYWQKERFILIGQVEEYDTFLLKFSELVERDFTKVGEERKAATKTQISEKERAQARFLLKDEYDWYNQFTS
ncbi:sulfotransferase family 2 domain-containing protein [Affinirhizobium pseudoryzae]|uniref:sulfotransferase family 2 domain-containing protein n=1 Tax=Allorhizobium pseudoryzae TaxID=379684 RepID=UPI0019D119DF|nr:sulfotransferase family 2 domain-containing protein [Allorhizobium pseudoryzae]